MVKVVDLSYQYTIELPLDTHCCFTSSYKAQQYMYYTVPSIKHNIITLRPLDHAPL